MNIYTEDFTPTFLYIKQHSVTGKLYFGKTVKDPEVYMGSGKHWTSHIKKHGREHIITLWYSLFLDRESCTQFALMFSEHQRIVESADWLNLMPENGLDGGCPGLILSEEHKQKISAAHKGKLFSEETRAKLSAAHKGKLLGPLSEETRAKMSAARKGKLRGPYSKKAKAIMTAAATEET